MECRLMAQTRCRVFALANLDASALVDAATSLRLGNGGIDFHWESSSDLMVVFASPADAVLFKLALGAGGSCVDGQLMLPTSEKERIDGVLDELDGRVSAAVVEFFRVWLPHGREHDQLLADLNGGGRSHAFRL
jgi:hypothetical protein